MRSPAVVCFLTFTLLITSVANAQREKRRQFVEGLLEGLIDSQLDKLIDDGRDNRGPNRDHAHGQTQPRPLPAPPEVQQARVELEHVSVSMRNLVNVLQSESYTSPAYRQPLAEAMHIKASIDGLYQNSAHVQDLRRLADAYIPVDKQWRSLAHRLTQARGVNRSVVALVKEINEHTTEMGGLVGLGPQLDRTKLIRLSSSLTTEFRHLLDDIGYEMRGNPNQTRYLRQGQSLLTAVGQSTAWIDRGDYDSLVQAWQQGQAGWRTYAAELRRLGNDRIRRDVMQIEQTGRQITEALWLPIPIDKDYLVHLVSSVKAETDHILTTVTMKDLMTSPHPGKLLRTASELQSSCGSFGQAIANSQSIDDLVWDFRVFAVAWQDMVQQSQTINNPDLQAHLVDGSETMALLNQSLGSGPQISPTQISQMVAQLGDLCNRTTRYVNRNIMPLREIDSRVKTSIQQHATAMQSSVQRLNTRMISRQPDSVIRKDLNSAIQHWNQLKPLMAQCREADQIAFRQLRGELEPMFVKLQVVYPR